jgi:tetratricopeptide (TPR) repeat protein
MKVDFRLRRLATPGQATAFLLPSHDSADLLRLCVRLGASEQPTISRTADGFLLRLPRPTQLVLPGVIGLRALAGNLFLPADAELIPPLLDDEAIGLVKQRGLIFLPGGRVLEFAPDEPVPLSAVLCASSIERSDWQPFPSPPVFAERIEEIRLDLPQPPVEEILESGGEDIGTEDPWSEDSPSAPAKLAGKSMMSLGKGLTWLGNALGFKGLANLGARLISGAVRLAPRLSEAILGAQEAALRALLREFREGDVERALRRALPIGGDMPRGALPYASARLPFHNLLYSLQNIWRGPESIWFGGYDVAKELAAEYRKLAEFASRKGDYRRAAFIYAKLLRDYRLAAMALESGGLYRDAAIVYREKVGDSYAAARAYEAGGMIDEALEIYRTRGDHELAGDLLCRAGEEDQAVQEYKLAAEKVVSSGQGYYKAGELMLTKARRPDLAVPYYREGWKIRPAQGPVACAIRLAQLHAQSRSHEELLGLIGEAGEYFRPAGRDTEAAEFFNEIARLAEQPDLAKLRDDLRDRSLMGIAGKIRQRVDCRMATAALVPSLLGTASVWPAAIVSDAQFAVKTALGEQEHKLPAASGTTIIQGLIPAVTGVCWAPETGDLFLGFTSGEVFCFRPQRGAVIPFPCNPQAGSVIVDKFTDTGQLLDPIVALATDPNGEHLVLVRKRAGGENASVSSYFKDSESSFVVRANRKVFSPSMPWLTPLISRGVSLDALWNGDKIEWSRDGLLIPMARLQATTYSPQYLVGGLLVPPDAALLVGADRVWYLANYLQNRAARPARIGWTPTLPPSSTLKSPLFSWVWSSPKEVELAGISAGGAVYWSSLRFHDRGVGVEATNATRDGQSYLAATIVRPGLVAAVTESRIEWYRAGKSQFTKEAVTEIAFPKAVACFAYQRSKELLVVCGDGSIGRVPMVK